MTCYTFLIARRRRYNLKTTHTEYCGINYTQEVVQSGVELTLYCLLSRVCFRQICHIIVIFCVTWTCVIIVENVLLYIVLYKERTITCRTCTSDQVFSVGEGDRKREKTCLWFSSLCLLNECVFIRSINKAFVITFCEHPCFRLVIHCFPCGFLMQQLYFQLKNTVALQNYAVKMHQ